MTFVPVSIANIGSLHQLAESALGEWLTNKWAQSPADIAPGFSINGQSAGLALDATVAPLGNRFRSAVRATDAVTINAAGDNVIWTPAAGKILTVFWIALSAPSNNPGTNLVTVKIGNQVRYIWDMGAPGAFSHWEPISSGNPNDALVVNLASAYNVRVNYTHSEV
jgi:hypothetical protein